MSKSTCISLLKKKKKKNPITFSGFKQIGTALWDLARTPQSSATGNVWLCAAAYEAAVQLLRVAASEARQGCCGRKDSAPSVTASCDSEPGYAHP